MFEYLYEAVSVYGRLDDKKYREVETYFYDAPKWLIDSFKIIKLEKEFTFIREGEPVTSIYLIIKGVVRAADYRIYGIVYDFMRVNDLEAMGGMELILDLPTYQATIETVTPCIAIKIPKDIYEKWLNSDMKAMKREAKTVGRYLIETDRKSRAYLFLQGADRLALYLSDQYKKSAKDGRLLVTSTRSEMSEMTGLCVRTINRSVKKFYENGWITKEGNRFSIDEKQYHQLNESIAGLIER